MDTDVLQSNIRNLSEQQMIQMYGDWIVDSQNLKTIAKKDDLVQTMVKRALHTGKSADNNRYQPKQQSSLSNFTYENCKKMAIRIYKDKLNNVSHNETVSNLSRVGRQLQRKIN